MSLLIVSTLLNFTLAGCSRVIGQAILTDGNLLRVEGYGTKSNIEVKCITPDAVRRLTGSEIPAGVPSAPCYTVVFASSSSSAISRAVTSYVNAERELNDKVATAVGGPQAPTSSAVAGDSTVKDVITTIVQDSASADSATVEARVKALGPALSTEKKTEIRRNLEYLRDRALNPDLAQKLKSAADAL